MGEKDYIDPEIAAALDATLDEGASADAPDRQSPPANKGGWTALVECLKRYTERAAVSASAIKAQPHTQIPFSLAPVRKVAPSGMLPADKPQFPRTQEELDPSVRSKGAAKYLLRRPRERTETMVPGVHFSDGRGLDDPDKE